MSLKTVVLIFIFCVLSSSCQAQTMPKDRPVDFNIEYSIGGGMVNASQHMTLKPDGCSYANQVNQNSNTINFSLSPQEFDDLYKVFRDNDFPSIKIDSSIMAYDKGGENITIAWGKERYNLGTIGTDVASQWRDEWAAIKAALMEIIKKQTEKNR